MSFTNEKWKKILEILFLDLNEPTTAIPFPKNVFEVSHPNV